MGRRYGGGRTTCESCKSIDVRVWHRTGQLRPGHYFSWLWTCDGEPSGNILVRTERDAVVLLYRVRSLGETEWKSVEQRVPIEWTPCQLGGQRPWFTCAVYSGGHYCGRRAAILYSAGRLFACRRCYQLAYASQQEMPRDRTLSRAQKIRTRLGGSPSVLEPFPVKPKGMHTRTYFRLRARAQAAESASFALTMNWIDRLRRL